MGCASEAGARWLTQLFSTEPADRPRAESAVLAVYRAAGFEAPRYFIWFDSPFAACDAVSLLLSEYHPALRLARARVEKSSAGRERSLRLRAALCRAVAEPDWQGAVSAIGPPMDPRWLRGRAFATTLQSALIAARLSLCKDPAALYAGYDEEDDLSRAEAYLWGPARGVLVGRGGSAPARSLMAASFYSIYSYVMMASDEAVAAGAPAPVLIAAAWTIARSAGPWWPFAQAAVLACRPLEIHRNARWLLHREDGPAALYRDGEAVFAFNGNRVPPGWILHPEDAPALRLRKRDPDLQRFAKARAGRVRRSSRDAPLLSRELPRDPQERLDLLRAGARGNLPLLDRYLGGEHSSVWRELVALGPRVRQDPFAADALAVAYEIMERVAANVNLVIERLRSIGYRFQTEAADSEEFPALAGQPSLLRVRKAAAAAGAGTAPERPAILRGRSPRSRLAPPAEPGEASFAHLPPGPAASRRILRLEKRVGALPLSLRAFYDVVGAVDLSGRHPSLSPPLDDRETAPDPLQVLGVEAALADFEGGSGDFRDSVSVCPDDLSKAGFSGGGSYRIAIPNASADAELLDECHGLLFVDYLRLCFRFGGFPGFDGLSAPPHEIELLRAGLAKF